jgi:small subunit ribosomal protein S3
MGQKVSPTGFRLGILYEWASRWYAPKKKYRHLLQRDMKIREIITRSIKDPGLEDILIVRPAPQIIEVTIRTSRPGVVIGAKGQIIKELENKVNAALAKMGSDEKARLQVHEVAVPELSAQIVAQQIAEQIVRKVSYRRAMKRAMDQAMEKNALGMRVEIAGRLNGAEIARRQWYQVGRIPRHTLRAHIDYGFAEALTKFGQIGVKVWIFKGEVPLGKRIYKWGGVPTDESTPA